MNNMGVKVRLLGAMTLAVMLTACGGSSDNSEKTQVKYETQVMRPEARVYNLYIPASLHEAYVGTRELMNNGTNTYVEVLKAQEDLLSAQITEVENRYEGIQALINLYNALGGF
jgi:predicted DNA-binding protein (UPF0278 family)